MSIARLNTNPAAGFADAVTSLGPGLVFPCVKVQQDYEDIADIICV